MGRPTSAGQQIQDLPRRRGEPPDAEIAAQHDDRDVGTAEEVGQVVR